MTFRRLRTRMTILYAGLFAIALMLVTLAVFTAITNSARGLVRDELGASGAVYGQLWDARSAQLRQGAAIMAQDYGFREAVATNDEPTVRSALDNLRVRQQVDGALILGTDGYVASVGVAMDDPVVDTLWQAFSAEDLDAGVLTIEGQPYRAVSAPVMAPVLIGWVVFVERLDSTQMRRLESLSAIPLTASVLTASPQGWRDMAGRTSPLDPVIKRALAAPSDRPVTARTSDGEAMVLAQPLPSLDATAPAVLTLSYPMTLALKPYASLFWALAAIALAGLALLLAGTWFLSRGLTRPITELDEAAHRLKAGEHAEVAVSSSDELGRLALSFNEMAADIRHREARLTQMALHDQETGLPNRLWLEREAGLNPDALMVLLGVDRFEVVRNAIGYESMGQLIVALAGRLAATAGGARVARVSAGVVGLMLHAAGRDDAMARAVALCGIADEPVTLAWATVDARLTAGLAGPDDDTGGVRSIVDRAAIALDQARDTRRPATFFDARAYGDPVDNLSLISDLMDALESDQVWMAYQPKYDLRANAITGVEALMRWNHPRRGFVPPDLFITMAEETGQIRGLTEWCLRRVIADQKALADAGHALTVSVNISGRLVSDAGFADFALAEVVRSGADLCFEITETAVIDNPDSVLGIVDRFSAAGICVSIDDYGSGLSSLSYLKQINADELKIDKAFVTGLDDSARDALVVKSTIDLAHSLGMTIVAEGVETPTALALLRGMGCDSAQGYLIGRPMPLASLIERLAQPAVEGEFKAA